MHMQSQQLAKLCGIHTQLEACQCGWHASCLHSRRGAQQSKPTTPSSHSSARAGQAASTSQLTAAGSTGVESMLVSACI
jgi:hypothetical protein